MKMENEDANGVERTSNGSACGGPATVKEPNEKTDELMLVDSLGSGMKVSMRHLGPSMKCNILVMNARVLEKPSTIRIDAHSARVRSCAGEEGTGITCREGHAECAEDYIPWRG